MQRHCEACEDTWGRQCVSRCKFVRESGADVQVGLAKHVPRCDHSLLKDWLALHEE